MARSSPTPSSRHSRHRQAAIQLFTTPVVKGFGIRITAAGARSFVLNYRTRLDASGVTPSAASPTGRPRRHEEARELRKVIDPAATRLAIFMPADRHRPWRTCVTASRPTLPRLRPSPQTSYRQQIAAEIRPALGTMKVAEVSFSDSTVCTDISKRGHPTEPTARWRCCRSCSAWRCAGATAPTIPSARSSVIPSTNATATSSGEELARLATALAEFPDG